MTTTLILVAGGEGKRFGNPKAFVKLGGQTLLERCLKTALGIDFLDEVVVVCRAADVEQIDSLLQSYREKLARRRWIVVEGGDQRADSVRRGFEVSTGDSVLVHNVANPMVTVDDIRNVMTQLDDFDMAFCGHRVVDTLRRVSEDKHVQTFDRTNVWLAQTPQAFRREVFEKLFSTERWKGATDEVQGGEQLGFSVVGVETGRENIKVTTAEDIAFLERFLGGARSVGIGEDSHRFSDLPSDPSVPRSGTSPLERGEPCLKLGGLRVEDCPALEGHSDADVILHALFNAISSALGHGSIGGVADRMVEEGVVDSKRFLTVPFEWMKKRGMRLNNVAVSLECSRPKIDPLVLDLKRSLASICGVDEHLIGITAMTGEGLTAFGRGEGIRCMVAISLTPIV